MRHPAAVAAFLLFAATGSAPADDQPSTDALVRELLAARTPDERKTRIDAIVAAKPDPAVVAKALAAGRAYAADVPKGWLEKTIVAPDGKERPYLLHVPEAYEPGKRWRMVGDLHGGVGRPQHLTHDELLEMKYFWGRQAEELGWFLALPSGDKDAMWWNATGSGMVLSIVDETRRDYDIDEDAVFASGFSDGASGCYHLAAAHATPFAGFIAMNGHVAVAGLGGVPVYLRNLTNRPIYAVNTDKDSLYPSAALKPVFDVLAELGAPVVWRQIEGYAHDPTYLPGERPAILKWMDGVRRDPARRELAWEGIESAPPRVDWLVVTSVKENWGNPEIPDVNPVLTDSRVRLGVMLDQEFAGPGVRISGVIDGSLAKTMGLMAGDVLVAVDGTDVADVGALLAAMGAKAAGQEIRVRVRRGDAEIEKTGTLAPPTSKPAFERTAPHGSIRAEVEDNRFEVHAYGVASFDLLLSPRLVDLSKPVTVGVNGAQVSSGTVETDLRFMLEHAAADQDRSNVQWARLSVHVPVCVR